MLGLSPARLLEGMCNEHHTRVCASTDMCRCPATKQQHTSHGTSQHASTGSNTVYCDNLYISCQQIGICKPQGGADQCKGQRTGETQPLRVSQHNIVAETQAWDVLGAHTRCIGCGGSTTLSIQAAPSAVVVCSACALQNPDTLLQDISA